ncbi:hypothetical protein [Micromonospora sp. LOL_023]|uniref:hypothetical protein n=1 Tax=Micromonospora sp. LOL_023 TaxID=3345418 RepID=UPI003A85F3DB
MTVCRGCCCGTVRKHPDIDHDRQLALLRSAVPVQVADCLNACERSNVVVVQPTPLARRLGARPVWLGDILDDATLSAVAEWATAGGPGHRALPGRLGPHRFPAPRWK